MENQILKKRLNTYKNENGKLRNVSEEVLFEFLRSYEQWTGTAKEFYRDISLSKMQFTALMKKSKQLNRDGRFSEASEFKEIQVEGGSVQGGVGSGAPCGIEICWDQGKVIRFAQVEQLVDFLKKVA
jgi:hypothetical protein